MTRLRRPSLRAGVVVAGVLLATLWGGFLGLCQLGGRATVLDRLEGPLLDLRFVLAGPRPPPGRVVIVALDDATIRLAGRYPVPRPVLAQLVRAIAAGGASAIGLDILFLDATTEAEDAALAQALRAAPSVIAAAGQFGSDAEGDDPRRPAPFAALPQVQAVDWPIPVLGGNAAVGLANVSADRGGSPRHLPLLLGYGAAIVPSFALRLAARATGASPRIGADRLRLGQTETRLDLGASLPLRFYGRRGTLRTISARDVLTGTAPAGVFGGRVALIGVTARGTGDAFATPFDPVLPGAELMGTAVSHLLAGDGLVRGRTVRRVDALEALLLPGLAILLVAWRRTAFGLALIAAVGTAWAILVFAAFQRGYWFSMSVPLGAVLPPLALFTASRLWLGRRSERRLEAAQATFRRFHPHALGALLAQRPGYLEQPVAREAAVLFIDLSGFTGVSERIGGDRTRDLLKQFHGRVEAALRDTNGLIVNYMGDGAMIVFGLVEARPDDARGALDTARSLAESVREWTRSVQAETGAALGVRVGGHFGPVVLSRLGGEEQQQITASGDTVNVASRLLETAATQGALVAASEDLCAAAERAGGSSAGFGPVSPVPIRGRIGALAVRFYAPDAG